MYRYFLARDDAHPTVGESYGHWHSIHLDSHGKAGAGWNVIILQDTHVQPHKDWVPFPRIVDAKTPVSAKINHALLADLGVTPSMTALEAADRLAAVHPAFAHP